MSATLLRAGSVLALDEADTLHQPGYVVVEGDRFTLLAPIVVAVRSRLAESLARRAFRLRAQHDIAAQEIAGAD